MMTLSVRMADAKLTGNAHKRGIGLGLADAKFWTVIGTSETGPDALQPGAISFDSKKPQDSRLTWGYHPTARVYIDHVLDPGLEARVALPALPHLHVRNAGSSDLPAALLSELSSKGKNAILCPPSQAAGQP